MSFGNLIKELRESKELLQRQLAASLEIDTPMFSKIERGERRAKREQVLKLAELLQTDVNELLTVWLADQVYEIVKDEEIAEGALRVAESTLKYSKLENMYKENQEANNTTVQEPLGLFPKDISIKPFLKWAGG